MKYNEDALPLPFFTRILQKINQHASNSVNPYTTFGVFGAVTYLLYFFLWKFANSGGYENLGLRLIVCALCIPLIFHNQWPKKLQKFLALYWYFTLMYCLPFLFTFLLLKNNLSQVWILNTMTVLILSVLLLDTLALSIILPLGTLLGWAAYELTTSSSFMLPHDSSGILITYASVVVFGALFANRKDKLQQDKFQAIRTLGASIAHELRTPFASLNVTAKTLETKITNLSKKIELPTESIEGLQHDVASIKKEVKASLTFIDMLLLNINPTINEAKIEDFSIKHCITDSLERFPFIGKQHQFVQWDESKNPDFIVRGEQLLIIHVFFNLLKNALYYIAKARKGNIEITIKDHAVYFKDTGTGIDKEHLPHIFKRFFSKTYHGAGVGLTFCEWVMVNLGGKITCESEEGHYTLFTLHFPNNT